MRFFSASLLSLTVAIPSMATASIPWSKELGKWQVSGITSISGVGDDDASVGLQQQHGSISLTARWQQGGEVYVTAQADKCGPEGKEFKADYSVSVSTWLKDRQATRSQVKADFRAWLRQIEFVCGQPKLIRGFEFEHFEPAFQAFTDWIIE